MTPPEHADRGRADPTVRVDVWLTSVRLFKTRSLAAKACRAGQVSIDGSNAKPSSPVAVGDRVEARVGNRMRIAEVTKLLTKRVGAAQAVECYIDHSPPPPPRDTPEGAFAVRERGSGRPTKRDRRQIDRLRGRR